MFLNFIYMLVKGRKLERAYRFSWQADGYFSGTKGKRIPVKTCLLFILISLRFVSLFWNNFFCINTFHIKIFVKIGMIDTLLTFRFSGWYYVLGSSIHLNWTEPYLHCVDSFLFAWAKTSSEIAVSFSDCPSNRLFVCL